MARIRSIRPEFFRHEGLQDLASKHGAHVMLVFAGLWGHCDKSGRFECRPRQLKLDILPFLDFDMAETLSVLEVAGFIQTYSVNGKSYGFIETFVKHQRISGKEALEPSKLPEPPVKQSGSNGEANEKHVPGQEEEGNGVQEGEEEGNGLEAREKIPASQNPNPASSKPVLEKSKGTRWHPDNIVPDEWLEAAADARERAGQPAIDMRLEVAKFSHYWSSADCTKPFKKDWRQTFVKWCLQARGNHQNGAGFGRKSQLEQLQEIIAGERAGTVIDG